jgi:hypothetical protein
VISNAVVIFRSFLTPALSHILALACITGHDGTLFALFNYMVSITDAVGGNTNEIKSDVREAGDTNPQQSQRMLEP